MKVTTKKLRLLPRIPVDLLLKLGSHPIMTKKGEKGYDRKKAKNELSRQQEEEDSK